jgi:hypothetical protein
MGRNPNPMYVAKGECPHCRVYVEYMIQDLGRPEATKFLNKHSLTLRVSECPSCRKPVIDLLEFYHTEDDIELLKQGLPREAHLKIRLLFPDAPVRLPPPEVTNKEIQRDYQEAHAVAPKSLRGAAALGRRALQHALRDKGFTAPSKKLADEIKEAVKSPDAPSSLREKLTFIRELGNDGAHPNPDHAGEIVDVTEDEFQVLMEAVDEFFDVFYVRPAKHKAVMEGRRERVKGKAPHQG